MLNRNFANAVVCNGGTNNSSNTPKLKKMEDGTYSSYYTGANIMTYMQTMGTAKIASLSESSTFTIGSGNTAETIDDYALETPIDETNFTILNGNPNRINANWNDTKMIPTQTWQYNGSTEITIKEVGYVVASGGSPHGTLYMFDRTVLESPITVNNGDTFTIALTIGGKATVAANS